jgi:hypothetical protein
MTRAVQKLCFLHPPDSVLEKYTGKVAQPLFKVRAFLRSVLPLLRSEKSVRICNHTCLKGEPYGTGIRLKVVVRRKAHIANN